MKGLFYGVAVSALLLGAGGAAMACDQHAKSTALENPAAATHAMNTRGFVLAQQEEQSGTTGEDSSETKPDESKSEAVPQRPIGPLAQSQDDADKEKAEEGKESKPEAVPSRGFVLAQMQQEGEQSGTTGEDTKEESKPEQEQK